ncbi:MAG: class F sortase [Acidimicrobiales bacterium]
MPGPHRRRVIHFTLVVLLAAGLSALGVAAYDALSPSYVTPAPAGTVPAALSTPATSAGPPHVNLAPAARAAAGVPFGLRFPALAVSAHVVPVSVGAGGALGVPADPHVLGWWEQGAAPGEAAGTVVVDGHVDTWNEGAGALFHLASALPGQQVTLVTTAGPITYTVVGRRTYPKQALPRSLFARSGAPRLVLITCGGPFDWTTRHYLDNVVAYAVPDDAAPAYRWARIGRTRVALLGAPSRWAGRISGPAPRLAHGRLLLSGRPTFAPVRVVGAERAVTLAFAYLDRLVAVIRVRPAGRGALTVRPPEPYTAVVEVGQATLRGARTGSAVVLSR